MDRTEDRGMGKQDIGHSSWTRWGVVKSFEVRRERVEGSKRRLWQSCTGPREELEERQFGREGGGRHDEVSGRRV